MDVLGCVAAFAAIAFFYLASSQQRLLRQPLGRGARLAAAALAVVAVLAWVASATSLPGFFAALTALMLGAVALPYLVWLVRPAAERSRR
ncbi:hypothetical protein [Luteibacter sp. UNCMF366Tsu5.1]|uniref:hypothetical protein n=1 Tax=Luteibacter sp. UNCMF366Tsu5.1 TaxID=1502758 RepID=UPI0009087D9B|nr:hypothetical protein [Luteibacter sp. UNCMF366Tsu5.1]SFW68630.1 hypothetical protein SAMN02800691_2947 [Luteibacter sp. UNCMF366Tsu5.1]